MRTSVRPSLFRSVLLLALATAPAVCALLTFTACTDDYIKIRTPTPTPDPPSDNARLSALVLSAPSEALSPAFNADVTSYAVNVGLYASTVTLTAMTESTAATLTIQGEPVPSGDPSPPIPLALGVNVVTVEVTAESGAVRDYELQVNRFSALTSTPFYFKASNTGSGDGFGWSVSASGDTLVVGAPEEDSSALGVNGNQADNAASASGAAFVFVRSGGTWAQQAYLKASNAGAGDEFGYSVSISGETIVVGAREEDSSATGIDGDQADNSAAQSGAAYVFVRNDGVWSQQAYLKASNTGAGDEFGYFVSVAGDSIVVGAPKEASNATGVNAGQSDNSATGSGAAYVFVRTGDSWSQQAYLKSSNTSVDDNFGVSVAISGDTIAVGANGEDSNATGINGIQSDNSASNRGAVYVFARSGGYWNQQAYVKPSTGGSGFQFGVSVAVVDETLAVGATGAGVAYVFTRTGSDWSQQSALSGSNTEIGDGFGSGIGVSENTLVVGAQYEDSGATGVDGDESDESSILSGASYVFARSGGVWNQKSYVKASNTESVDYFGRSVAVSGDTIVVGAYYEDSSATGIGGNQADGSAVDSGAVYVYH